MSTPSGGAFRRDRFTWLAYLMLAYFAYLQASIGPIMPFLRDELGLSYTVGGLHVSAMAFGLVSGGLTAEGAITRWGRRRIFWGGGGGMAGGALILALGPVAPLTILGAFLMGFLGTLLLITIQSSLADHHGPHRAIPLTESNVAASVTAGLAPFFVGGFARLGIGWRSALLLAGLVWLAALVRLRDEPIPRPRQAPRKAGKGNHRLPAGFWVYALIIMLCVGAEWSIVAWGADFLVDVGKLRKADASLIMTLFFAAMAFGRYSGSRLTRLMDTQRLMTAAVALSLLGFVPFWLSPLSGLRVAGLFVAGLGVANLFPFMLTIAVGAGAAQSDLASARVALMAGLAILLAPQTLGWAADQTGIRAAYGLVFGLLLTAGALTLVSSRIVAGAVSRAPEGQR